MQIAGLSRLSPLTVHLFAVNEIHLSQFQVTSHCPLVCNSFRRTCVLSAGKHDEPMIGSEPIERGYKPRSLTFRTSALAAAFRVMTPNLRQNVNQSAYGSLPTPVFFFSF